MRWRKKYLRSETCISQYTGSRIWSNVVNSMKTMDSGHGYYVRDTLRQGATWTFAGTSVQRLTKSLCETSLCCLQHPWQFRFLVKNEEALLGSSKGRKPIQTESLFFFFPPRRDNVADLYVYRSPILRTIPIPIEIFHHSTSDIVFSTTNYKTVKLKIERNKWI